MTKKQIGEIVFAEIKNYIYAHGYSMKQEGFPSDFPISRRKCYDIKDGLWTEVIFDALPFKVEIEYVLRIEGKTKRPR